MWIVTKKVKYAKNLHFFTGKKKNFLFHHPNCFSFTTEPELYRLSSDDGVFQTCQQKPAMQMSMKRISRIALKIFSAMSRLTGICMPILSFTAPITNATMRNKIEPVIKPRITAAAIRSIPGLSAFLDMMSVSPARYLVIG
jgi:hypothetical protein